MGVKETGQRLMNPPKGAGGKSMGEEKKKRGVETEERREGG